MRRLSILLLLLAPIVLSCTVGQEAESVTGSRLYKECIPIIASASADSKVSVGIEDVAGEKASRMNWEAGDRIIISSGGSFYVYETEDSGRQAVFYAINQSNAITSFVEGTALTAWYNVSSVKPSGQGVFSITADQVEGASSNKVTLCAEYTVGADFNGSIPLVFKPLVSVLEFSISSNFDCEVDRIVLTPCDGATGYTIMSKADVNAHDGSVSPKSSSLSPLSLTLSGSGNIAGGRTIRFISGKVKMDQTGALMEWFKGDEKIFSKTIWGSKTIDLTTSNRHIYQPIAELQGEAVVRNSHPRMFFNQKDIPAMRSLANGRLKNHEYRWMLERIDPLLDQPITFPNPLERDGSDNDNHQWGFRLHESALLWLLTGDQKYLDFSKRLMKSLTEYYQLRNANDLNINWYMYSQACAACAWDWIYNDLTPEEREELGPPFFEALCDIAWFDGKRSKHYRENVSDHTSGCYGTRHLPWYIALAFYGDGIDDAACENMFKIGLQLNQKMVDFRKETIGDAPGAATPCVVYSLGYYPVADFNYIRLLKSATGIDVSEDMLYVARYMDYIDWITIAGNLSYGFGDEHHTSCKLPVKEINYSLREIAQLYGARHPEIPPKASRLLDEFTTKYMAATFPVIPFLQFDEQPSPEPAPSTTNALYCESMGEVFMRSGTGANDTYCLFASGGQVDNHKHFDNNHFTIYKYGFRALDSGTRPEPGLHLPYYYARTVAHNCVTVRMPGEVMPSYWGEAAPEEDSTLPVPNDGGQCSALGSVLKSMRETTTYVALSSDATACYHSSKVSLVERDFVWLKPDLFVVFDRVESKNKNYPKKWLLHTINEPQMNGAMEWSETSGGGKMICRTLWPANAAVEKIGGEGREYWSDGRNWPLPVDLPSNIPDRNEPNFGRWRVEVSPGSAALRDCFLHMIMVGDTTLTSLPESETWESGGKIHIRFVYGGNQFVLSFDKNADSGVDIIEHVQPGAGFEDYTFNGQNEE